MRLQESLHLVIRAKSHVCPKFWTKTVKFHMDNFSFLSLQIHLKANEPNIFTKDTRQHTNSIES